LITGNRLDVLYMVCSKCKKRMAVVFMSGFENGKQVDKGYCMICAKELGIKQVTDLIEKMGLSDEDIEAMYGQDADAFAAQMDGFDGFEMGGAMPMPFMNTTSDSSEKTEAKQGSTDKKEQKTKKRKFLDTYCTNLTQKASDGKIDRIIGRDKEIYRVLQILNRRTKNNPCLIGEPGVGKTAIAEGIALRMASGDVPPKLMGKELHLLDLTALVAGTQFRGQFESRVKGLIDEVKAEGNIILFIDEVHNLVGTGDSEGSMNAANILKPALSRGEIQVIGATTFNEYRKYIEKDAALERRFQSVVVEEPNIEDSIDVLLGVKQYYENFHKVSIADKIIRDCVILSERYITDRFLPDKAIDLLDEACSCASLKNKELAEYEKLSAQLYDLEQEEKSIQENPDKEGSINYERIAQIKAEVLRINSRQDELRDKAFSMKVTDDDVSRVIELWTGIPASKIKENELGRIANLDKVLKEKIIGQDEAVDLVCAAIRRSRAQISPRKRPASFIFVGPTGVGKTELVKVLAKELFNTVDPLIRLDMSEFMEKFAVSRIVGSPPGYVGYDEAGQLTEKVRRKPYSVILFDEIEKAHPDVMNILLQILDEGRITDAHGRTVNFENTVIVMTSNAGSNRNDASVGFGKSQTEIAKDKATKALREFLRPEFIGRVDEIVAFSPLSDEDFAKIAKLMVEELREPLMQKGIRLDYTDAVLDFIVKKADSRKSGARELRQVIRKHIEDIIAFEIVNNADNLPVAVKLDVQDEKIVLTPSDSFN